MDFAEKLLELRKKKGLTQEELAQSLYVSRTAISKWESGRGYPNIESLKAISRFFNVTIDELLSSERLLALAENEQKQTSRNLREQVFGLLDCSVLLFLFLPVFGNHLDGTVKAVSLIQYSAATPWNKGALWLVTIAMATLGMMTLVFQQPCFARLERWKISLSMSLGIAGTLLCILSRQPYAALLMFVFLIVKQALVLKSK